MGKNEVTEEDLKAHRIEMEERARLEELAPDMREALRRINAQLPRPLTKEIELTIGLYLAITNLRLVQAKIYGMPEEKTPTYEEILGNDGEDAQPEDCDAEAVEIQAEDYPEGYGYAEVIFEEIGDIENGPKLDTQFVSPTTGLSLSEAKKNVVSMNNLYPKRTFRLVYNRGGY